MPEHSEKQPPSAHVAPVGGTRRTFDVVGIGRGLNNTSTSTDRLNRGERRGRMLPIERTLPDREVHRRNDDLRSRRRTENPLQGLEPFAGLHTESKHLLGQRGGRWLLRFRDGAKGAGLDNFANRLTRTDPLHAEVDDIDQNASSVVDDGDVEQGKAVDGVCRESDVAPHMARHSLEHENPPI